MAASVLGSGAHAAGRRARPVAGPCRETTARRQSRTRRALQVMMKMLERMSRTACRSFRVPKSLRAATSPCRPASSPSRCWTGVSQTLGNQMEAQNASKGKREGRRMPHRRLLMMLILGAERSLARCSSSPGLSFRACRGMAESRCRGRITISRDRPHIQLTICVHSRKGIATTYSTPKGGREANRFRCEVCLESSDPRKPARAAKSR